MGLFQREVTEMTDIGLSNMDAVLSGTSEAAKSIGMDHLVGTLEPTKEADVVVVEGKPAAGHRGAFKHQRRLQGGSAGGLAPRIREKRGGGEVSV